MSALANWPIFLALGTLGLVLFVSIRQLRSQKPPYVRRGPLLTEGELAFYRALREAVGDAWTISAMVRLADLIRVRADAPQAQNWRSRIACQHVDFVLCDTQTMDVRLAVELDEPGHQRADSGQRGERGAVVNQALDAAGIPLLRVTAAGAYDALQLRQTIHERVGG
ncbi:MAG: DUF2726 domain-containing protein [Pirellulaceae bacterium]|nr:DUF2726 domain-containing protein [Pirellulaceae bacterium]